MRLKFLSVIEQSRPRNMDEATKWDLFLVIAGECMGRRSAPSRSNSPRLKHALNNLATPQMGRISESVAMINKNTADV